MLPLDSLLRLLNPLPIFISYLLLCIPVFPQHLPSMQIRNGSDTVPVKFAFFFGWFPCVYKRMLEWFPRLQVAAACFSCSPPDRNYLDPYFIFMYMHNNHCHLVTAHLQSNISSSSSSSSSPSPSSPLCRIFIFIFLRKTMSLANTVLQLFCCYYSWCLYR